MAIGSSGCERRSPTAPQRPVATGGFPLRRMSLPSSRPKTAKSVAATVPSAPQAPQTSSIAQQRVCFVEDEKGAKIGGFFERGGDRFFRLAEPHRAEIGEPLFQDIQIEALGEVMSVGRLSRSGRTRETEGEGSRSRSCNLVGQFDEVDVS